MVLGAIGCYCKGNINVPLFMFCVTVRFRYVSFVFAGVTRGEGHEGENQWRGGREGGGDKHAQGRTQGRKQGRHKGRSEGGKGEGGGVETTCQFVVKTGSPGQFICTYNTIWSYQYATLSISM